MPLHTDWKIKTPISWSCQPVPFLWFFTRQKWEALFFRFNNGVYEEQWRETTQSEIERHCYD